MPYIDQYKRPKFDKAIQESLKALSKDQFSVGDINYLFSSIIWKAWEKMGGGYTNANNLIGVLECIKLELYRRPISNYENEKIISNGDINE